MQATVEQGVQQEDVETAMVIEGRVGGYRKNDKERRARMEEEEKEKEEED
jgi:hypothetical protein